MSRLIWDDSDFLKEKDWTIAWILESSIPGGFLAGSSRLDLSSHVGWQAIVSRHVWDDSDFVKEKDWTIAWILKSLVPGGFQAGSELPGWI